MLSNLKAGETLVPYLAISDFAVSFVLVEEEDGIQLPVYYMSKRLADVETRYTSLEKLAYALILASRKLRPYFQARRIEVRISYPLRQVMHKPEYSGQMLKWTFELGQFEVDYKPRTAIKGQALADFVLEFPPHQEVEQGALVVMPSAEEVGLESQNSALWWSLFMDGASNGDGAGAGIELISPEAHKIRCATHLAFHATNNDAEYEALINGLKLALELKVENLNVFNDSMIVVYQINGGYQAKGPRTELYLKRIDLIGELPKAKRGVKYAVVAVDYFTKWVEAEPLATITEKKLKEFVNRTIVFRYGIPYKLAKLEERKWTWPEELAQVLWSYNTTLQTTSGVTPLLVYGCEAMVPVEVGEESFRRDNYNSEANEANEVNHRLYLDMIKETREDAQIRIIAYQQRTARHYNSKV
ncbi:uncharacterized protein LOC141705524 [Apium graveolens]|uniref:uncharacterized protein LOC141705524 n=1 Tax=Apium graveolens TaxID=4045 RepID=UPI003D7AF0D5